MSDTKINYTIVNPYENVDWEKVSTYKANLHTHTTASDGEVALSDMVEAYYKADYDILSITDHGVINTGWRDDRKTHGIFNKFREVVPMSDEQYKRITTGSDRAERGIVDVTGGIECNMAVFSKVHVNGYFTTYGSGVWGRENDYKTATVKIEKMGGYSVLNHVGDWVNSNNFPKRSHSPLFISYFADILTSSKSCLGMEIINNRDNVTRADRALWDELLQVVIPTGRNIWAFADDDSERLNEVGRSFELFPLEINNEENVKNAMITGAFFAAGKYDKTDRNNEIEGNGLVPLVKEIKVDNEKNTISVTVDESRDCKNIEWIANGEVISTDYTINLNDYQDKLGCYIRFQLHGDGGVTYSQAFELKYEGRADKEVPKSFICDTIVGKAIKLIWQTRFVAINQFILEKLGLMMKIIPVKSK